MKYKRVLLKLSGEALAGDDHFGINANTVADIARQIKEAKDLGVEIAIVCGGGNIWRGVTGAQMGMERSSADRKSTRLNSSHKVQSRMPSSA